MEISLFLDDLYYEEVGLELSRRGHTVLYNQLSDTTAKVFIFGCPATFEFVNYLKNRYELERFNYTGQTYPIVFDLPYWRFKDESWNKYYQNYKSILAKSTKILAISEFTSNQLKEIWGMDSEPIKFMFNDRLIDKYKNPGLTRNPNQIIMVSRYAINKRFDLVIRAVQDTPYKLIMCGRPGGMENYYRTLAESLDINFELHINPDYEFIVKKYCDSGLCIHASVFEGFSIVPKEALYCGCPVLLSDIPTHHEYHKTGITFFNKDDIDGLKKKLIAGQFNKPEPKDINELTISKFVDRVMKQ